jgi:hypothetical protein
MLALPGDPLSGTDMRNVRQERHRPGRLVVEVVEILDGSPVANIRVELLQTGQTLLTDANGRVEFRVRPGEYDTRVYDLAGPGPARRTVDTHSSVTLGRPVVVQVFNCSACV